MTNTPSVTTTGGPTPSGAAGWPVLLVAVALLRRDSPGQNGAHRRLAGTRAKETPWDWTTSRRRRRSSSPTDKVKEALDSEQAEDISDKLLDGVADADQQGRPADKFDEQESPRAEATSTRHSSSSADR